MTEKLTIKIIRHTLTDGSEVFSVLLMDMENRQSLQFDATTENGALAFADGFKKIIDDFTLVNDVWVG